MISISYLRVQFYLTTLIKIVCHFGTKGASFPSNMLYCLQGSILHSDVTRRFRNKCDIVEEPNSSSKHGIILLPINEKPSVLIKILTNQKALLMFVILGMIAKVS